MLLGDLDRYLYGSVPLVVYDTVPVYVGDLDRTFYGSLPMIVGPVTYIDGAQTVIASGETQTDEKVLIEDLFDLVQSADNVSEFAGNYVYVDYVGPRRFVDYPGPRRFNDSVKSRRFADYVGTRQFVDSVRSRQFIDHVEARGTV